MALEFQEEKQNKQIQILRRKEEEESVKRLAQKTNIPYVDLTSITIETDALAIIPEATAKKIEAAGFKIVGKDFYVAIRSPEKPGVREELFRLQNDGYTVGVYLASRRSLEKAWSRYEDIARTEKSRSSFLDISKSALETLTEKIKTNDDIGGLIDEVRESKDLKRVTQLIEVMLGSSIATGSSDVHIEPQEEDVVIRFRQDGVLQDIARIDHDLYGKVNSRIKILSRLKLTQHKQAQDGRFTIDYRDQEIEIRTSIVPGAYGESIVMRILNPDIINIELKSLGIEPKLFSVLRKEIHKPNGLILTTGPTGSGKTTTLYSFLKEIYTPAIKILTIEDPIEYHLEGITQTQVNKEKGYTFLSGLRGALRQDPDAIMVGEIRDSETAEIAVNASLTGHIVISTLHTNNAAGAIPRLLDLGINPKVLPSALTASIAQRLVRKLVPECRESYKPDAETEALIRKILKRAEYHGKDLESYGASADQEIVLYRPKKTPCAVGNGTGYKGRIGIFEAILMDEEIEALVTKNPSEREIRRIADKQGLLTMQEDGVLKALAGVTSLEEIRKIVDLEEYLDDEEIPTTPPQKAAPAQPAVASPAPEPEEDNHIFHELPGFVVEESTPTKEPAPTPTPNQAILESAMPEPTTTAGSDAAMNERMAAIERSLSRMAELLAQTTEHVVTQPAARPVATTTSPLPALREVRKREHEHSQDVALLDERYPAEDDDAVATKIADAVRDMELHLLLEKINQLEAGQQANPHEDITEDLKSIRKTIVDLLMINPPVRGNQKHELLERELRAVLDHVFTVEKDQVMNRTKGADKDLKHTKEKLQKALTE